MVNLTSFLFYILLRNKKAAVGLFKRSWSGWRFSEDINKGSAHNWCADPAVI